MTIFLQNHQVTYEKFPDGTPHMKVVETNQLPKELLFDGVVMEVSRKDITWLYQPNEEMELFHLVKHIRNSEPSSKIYLNLPYIPNARMDRVEDKEEVFTLKSFCEFINSLGFERVTVLDPHSNVSTALIDRVLVDVVTLKRFHEQVLEEYKPDVLFFPDAGAYKRYSKLGHFSKYQSTFANKTRDWRTGEILWLTIATPGLIKNNRVLIVDDICSYGGTFVKSVKLLDECNASNIALAVTHCEDSITKGELLKLEKLEKVFTTNSLLKESSDKIDIAFNLSPQKD